MSYNATIENNGRVADTTQNDNFELYKLFREEESRPYRWINEQVLKNIHTQNDVSEVFFGRHNIDAVQEAIRYLVYQKSCGKHIIDKQSETDLIVIMRSIYLEYGEFKPYDINEQIKALNARVLEYCVPRILQEIKLYLQYRSDITNLPVPLDRGQFVSAKGTKVLQQSF